MKVIINGSINVQVLAESIVEVAERYPFSEEEIKKAISELEEKKQIVRDMGIYEENEILIKASQLYLADGKKSI